MTVDATALDDPFLTADQVRRATSEDPERITGGRYRLPDLTVGQEGELLTGAGPRTGGWQRVTTFVKAVSDAWALDAWHQRQMITGMVLREDLYDLACATLATCPPEDLRSALDDLAKKILAAAKTDRGSNLGTAFHGFTEAEDLGMQSYARRKWRGKLGNWRSGLALQGLRVRPEYIERRVVVLKYGLAGTLDRLLWDLVAEIYRVADLKSQKTFYTWLQIAAQQTAYAIADAMWCRARLCYVEMPRVAQDLAVVAWMPEDHPAALDTGLDRDRDIVDFFDVDLEKGRRVLEVCAEVIALRAESGSPRQTWGLLRPAPELGLVESYARRLDTVASPVEGSALWAEIVARGLDGTPELRELAAQIASRFSASVS